MPKKVVNPCITQRLPLRVETLWDRLALSFPDVSLFLSPSRVLVLICLHDSPPP
jgi:hypothetical protein